MWDEWKTVMEMNARGIAAVCTLKARPCSRAFFVPMVLVDDYP
jgi:hypothetical protein